MIQFSSRQTFHPTLIYVEKEIRDSRMAQRILAKYPDLEQIEVDDATTVLDLAAADTDKHRWRGQILLARQRGPFLRLCPGTQKHICCMYHNLDVAAGCDLGCTYCILQGYLNNPLITFYCNTDDMFTELDNKLSRHSSAFYRIGTGELSDSLTFEHINELGPELVRYFADKKNAIIELKSKNVHIDDLLGLKHNRRSVISWSMNSAAVRDREEGLATTIEDRLAAAAEVQKAGYRLGFHFDPMIEHDGWQEGYRETVDGIFRVIKPENIAWISLGALRYPAPFEDILRENHPQSDIYLGELLLGVDKKRRYFKPIRIEMFSKMVQWIRSYSHDVFVYLCMESEEIWKKSFGWSPKNSGELKRMLDERVRATPGSPR